MRFLESGSLKRITALLTSAIFLVTSLPEAGFAARISDESLPVVKAYSPLEVGKIDLSEAGTIKERYQGDSGQTVILIQDAHEIPDAQRNIESLIRHFSERYGITNVALEGAAQDSEFDPQFFRSFPDPSRLQEVVNQYFENGEIAGGTAAILQQGAWRKEHGGSKLQAPSPMPHAQFVGVEDWNLFQDGIEAYQKAMQQDPDNLAAIEKQIQTIQEIKARTLSSDLLKADAALQSFYQNHSNLIEVLQLFSALMPPQGDLQQLLNETSAEAQSPTGLDSEIRSIVSKIQTAVRTGKIKAENAKEFQSRYQDYQTSSMTPRAFSDFLHEFLKQNSLDLRLSQSFKKSAGEGKMLRDLEGSKLIENFESYIDEVFTRASAQGGSENILELHEKSKMLRLITRLIRLELSHDDWNLIKTDFSDLKATYPEHFLFYEISEQREEAMLANLLKIQGDRVQGTGNREQGSGYREQGIGNRDEPGRTDFQTQADFVASETLHPVPRTLNPLLLVAGGFHTAGLAERLKALGISYLAVMPRMDQVPDQTNYRKHMAGDVSWKKYFEVRDGKVNLYEAFARGMRDALVHRPWTIDHRQKQADLIYGLSTMDYGLAKRWRDQILRDLSDQGRIAEAGNYTRFLDELTDNGASKAREEKIQQLTAEWRANIENFITKIRDLDQRGQFNEANVRSLLTPSSTSPTPSTSSSVLAPRSELRSSLLNTNPSTISPGTFSAPPFAGTDPLLRRSETLASQRRASSGGPGVPGSNDQGSSITIKSMQDARSEVRGTGDRIKPAQREQILKLRALIAKNKVFDALKMLSAIVNQSQGAYERGFRYLSSELAQIDALEKEEEKSSPLAAVLKIIDLLAAGPEDFTPEAYLQMIMMAKPEEVLVRFLDYLRIIRANKKTVEEQSLSAEEIQTAWDFVVELQQTPNPENRARFRDFLLSIQRRVNEPDPEMDISTGVLRRSETRAEKGVAPSDETDPNAEARAVSRGYSGMNISAEGRRLSQAMEKLRDLSEQDRIQNDYILEFKAQDFPDRNEIEVVVNYLYLTENRRPIGQSLMVLKNLESQGPYINSQGTNIDDGHQQKGLKSRVNTLIKKFAPKGTLFESTIDNEDTLKAISKVMIERMNRGHRGESIPNETPLEMILRAYEAGVRLSSEELADCGPVGKLGNALGPYQEIEARGVKNGLGQTNITVHHRIWIGADVKPSPRSELRENAGERGAARNWIRAAVVAGWLGIVTALRDENPALYPESEPPLSTEAIRFAGTDQGGAVISNLSEVPDRGVKAKRAPSLKPADTLETFFSSKAVSDRFYQINGVWFARDPESIWAKLLKDHGMEGIFKKLPSYEDDDGNPVEDPGFVDRMKGLEAFDRVMHYDSEKGEFELVNDAALKRRERERLGIGADAPATGERAGGQDYSLGDAPIAIITDGSDVYLPEPESPEDENQGQNPPVTGIPGLPPQLPGRPVLRIETSNDRVILQIVNPVAGEAVEIFAAGNPAGPFRRIHQSAVGETGAIFSFPRGASAMQFFYIRTASPRSELRDGLEMIHSAFQFSLNTPELWGIAGGLLFAYAGLFALRSRRVELHLLPILGLLALLGSGSGFFVQPLARAVFDPLKPPAEYLELLKSEGIPYRADADTQKVLRNIFGAGNYLELREVWNEIPSALKKSPAVKQAWEYQMNQIRSELRSQMETEATMTDAGPMTGNRDSRKEKLITNIMTVLAALGIAALCAAMILPQISGFKSGSSPSSVQSESSLAPPLGVFSLVDRAPLDLKFGRGLGEGRALVFDLNHPVDPVESSPFLNEQCQLLLVRDSAGHLYAGHFSLIAAGQPISLWDAENQLAAFFDWVRETSNGPLDEFFIASMDGSPWGPIMNRYLKENFGKEPFAKTFQGSHYGFRALIDGNQIRFTREDGLEYGTLTAPLNAEGFNWIPSSELSSRNELRDSPRSELRSQGVRSGIESLVDQLPLEQAILKGLNESAALKAADGAVYRLHAEEGLRSIEVFLIDSDKRRSREPVLELGVQSYGITSMRIKLSKVQWGEDPKIFDLSGKGLGLQIYQKLGAALPYEILIEMIVDRLKLRAWIYDHYFLRDGQVYRKGDEGKPDLKVVEELKAGDGEILIQDFLRGAPNDGFFAAWGIRSIASLSYKKSDEKQFRQVDALREMLRDVRSERDENGEMRTMVRPFDLRVMAGGRPRVRNDESATIRRYLLDTNLNAGDLVKDPKAAAHFFNVLIRSIRIWWSSQPGSGTKSFMSLGERSENAAERHGYFHDPKGFALIVRPFILGEAEVTPEILGRAGIMAKRVLAEFEKGRLAGTSIHVPRREKVAYALTRVIHYFVIGFAFYAAFGAAWSAVWQWLGMEWAGIAGGVIGAFVLALRTLISRFSRIATRPLRSAIMKATRKVLPENPYRKALRNHLSGAEDEPPSRSELRAGWNRRQKEENAFYYEPPEYQRDVALFYLRDDLERIRRLLDDNQNEKDPVTVASLRDKYEKMMNSYRLYNQNGGRSQTAEVHRVTKALWQTLKVRYFVPSIETLKQQIEKAERQEISVPSRLPELYREMFDSYELLSRMAETHEVPQLQEDDLAEFDGWREQIHLLTDRLSKLGITDPILRSELRSDPQSQASTPEMPDLQVWEDRKDLKSGRKQHSVYERFHQLKKDWYEQKIKTPSAKDEEGDFDKRIVQTVHELMGQYPAWKVFPYAWMAWVDAPSIGEANKRALNRDWYKHITSLIQGVIQEMPLNSEDVSSLLIMVRSGPIEVMAEDVNMLKLLLNRMKNSHVENLPLRFAELIAPAYEGDIDILAYAEHLWGSLLQFYDQFENPDFSWFKDVLDILRRREIQLVKEQEPSEEPSTALFRGALAINLLFGTGSSDAGYLAQYETLKEEAGEAGLTKPLRRALKRKNGGAYEELSEYHTLMIRLVEAAFEAGFSRAEVLKTLDELAANRGHSDAFEPGSNFSYLRFLKALRESSFKYNEGELEEGLKHWLPRVKAEEFMIFLKDKIPEFRLHGDVPMSDDHAARLRTIFEARSAEIFIQEWLKVIYRFSRRTLPPLTDEELDADFFTALLQPGEGVAAHQPGTGFVTRYVDASFSSIDPLQRRSKDPKVHVYQITIAGMEPRKALLEKLDQWILKHQNDFAVIYKCNESRGDWERDNSFTFYFWTEDGKPWRIPNQEELQELWKDVEVYRRKQSIGWQPVGYNLVTGNIYESPSVTREQHAELVRSLEALDPIYPGLKLPIINAMNKVMRSNPKIGAYASIGTYAASLRLRDFVLSVAKEFEASRSEMRSVNGAVPVAAPARYQDAERIIQRADAEVLRPVWEIYQALAAGEVFPQRLLPDSETISASVVILTITDNGTFELIPWEQTSKQYQLSKQVYNYMVSRLREAEEAAMRLRPPAESDTPVSHFRYLSVVLAFWIQGLSLTWRGFDGESTPVPTANQVLNSIPKLMQDAGLSSMGSNLLAQDSPRSEMRRDVERTARASVPRQGPRGEMRSAALAKNRGEPFGGLREVSAVEPLPKIDKPEAQPSSSSRFSGEKHIRSEIRSVSEIRTAVDEFYPYFLNEDVESQNYVAAGIDAVTSAVGDPLDVAASLQHMADLIQVLRENGYDAKFKHRIIEAVKKTYPEILEHADLQNSDQVEPLIQTALSIDTMERDSFDVSGVRVSLLDLFWQKAPRSEKEWVDSQLGSNNEGLADYLRTAQIRAQQEGYYQDKAFVTKLWVISEFIKRLQILIGEENYPENFSSRLRLFAKAHELHRRLTQNGRARVRLPFERQFTDELVVSVQTFETYLSEFITESTVRSEIRDVANDLVMSLAPPGVVLPAERKSIWIPGLTEPDLEAALREMDLAGLVRKNLAANPHLDHKVLANMFESWLASSDSNRAGTLIWDFNGVGAAEQEAIVRALVANRSEVRQAKFILESGSLAPTVIISLIREAEIPYTLIRRAPSGEETKIILGKGRAPEAAGYLSIRTNAQGVDDPLMAYPESLLQQAIWGILLEIDPNGESLSNSEKASQVREELVRRLFKSIPGAEGVIQGKGGQFVVNRAVLRTLLLKIQADQASAVAA